MQLEILPLAITMVAGPQMLASIIFITSKRDPVKVSAGYLLGILCTTAIFISAVFLLARAFGISADAHGNAPKKVTVVEVILIGLLVFAAIRSYLTRATSKPPKWLSKLQDFTPAGAFKLAIPLFCLMPGDFIVMVTVGLHLAGHGWSAGDLVSIIPFIAVVLLLAGSPLLAFLAFRKRASRTIPKMRDWIQHNSWLVNIVVYCVFIYLILT
ncbi:MAG TPA: GAP family protein [Candidatus Saccharimonadales bacterium]|nr:GAP family protein [Candidatus Saccharimonadales bacterium]